MSTPSLPLLTAAYWYLWEQALNCMTIFGHAGHSIQTNTPFMLNEPCKPLRIECMRNYTVFNFLRFTIIIVYGLRRMFFVCMRRFTQNSNYGFLEFPYKHTAFESHCSVAPSYLLPFFLHYYVNCSS